MPAERSSPEHPDGGAVADQAATHVLVVPREHYADALSLATAAPPLLADVVRAAGEVAVKDGIAESERP